MSNPQKFGTFYYEFEEAALLFSCSYGDGSQSQQADVQLYTTEEIPEGDPDLGGHQGIALKFIDGQTVKTILNPQDNLFYQFDQQQGWTPFPFEQKLQALQQQYPQVKQQALYQPWCDQNNEQVTTKMVLTDFNRTAKYAGSLTADYINKETKDNFEIDEVFDHIKENIEKALEKNQPVELSLGDFCTLKATMKVEKKNQTRSFEIVCQMKKVEIDPTEKEDIKTRFQNKIINKIKNEVENLKKSQQQGNQNSQDSQLIQQLSQQVSQLNQINLQQQQHSSNLENKINQLIEQQQQQEQQVNKLNQINQQKQYPNSYQEKKINQLIQKQEQQATKINQINQQQYQLNSNLEIKIIDLMKQSKQEVAQINQQQYELQSNLENKINDLIKQLEQQEQQVAELNQINLQQQQHSSNLENQINQLIQQQEQEVFKLNQINQQQQQLNSNLSDQINHLNNRIQQLSLQVSAPKAQPEVISLAQLQQGQNGYYYSQNFQGFYEFRIVLLDHEVEFEIGILRDGDFENLDVRAGAVYFELPDGKFRRGSNDSERVLSYPFFKGTIISVKVDTQKHIIQLALNDFDFAPLTLPKSIEQFAFLLKVTTQGAQISDYFESDQEVQQY